MNERILANVGGMPISDRDVDEFLAELGERGKAYNTPEGRKRILEQLIDNKLFLLDARRNLLEAEPEFKAQLAKLRDRLLINYNAERAFSSITVSDAEAEKYYNENADKFVAPETVNASHILVDTEDKAKKIFSDIAAGKITFDDAAREYSSCPSKENGGDLGDFGKGQMVPEFDAAVFAMKEGEITAEPVKTQFGYHLIRLNKKSTGEKIPFTDVKERIKEALLAEKQQQAYSSKVAQLKILYPVDILG